MKTSTRVIIFLTLIVVYVGLVKLFGAKLSLFTIRYHGTLGMEFFLIGDFMTCFCEGPFIGPMDPYPYRKTIVFTGSLVMVFSLFLKLVIG